MESAGGQGHCVKAEILEPNPENLARAARALGAGELVAIPTETVYGLAGTAFHTPALAKIFNAKERPTFDPLIIHVAWDAARPRSRVDWLAQLRLVDAPALDDAARKRIEDLTRDFWPGPLTLVLPKHSDVPDLATSGLPTVAIRMPRHPVAQALIRLAGTPLAAPSANRFGRISPTRAEHVRAELGDRIGLIVDGGPCQVGLESTILSVGKGGELTLLRPGGTPLDRIEESTGATVRIPSAHALGTAPQAPGMLESHYAPVKALYLLPEAVSALARLESKELEKIPPKASVGLLILSGDPNEAATRFSKLTGHPVVAKSLSQDGSLEEAAQNLFRELRYLDASEAAVIFAEPCPADRGLGHAIADRLRRASRR